MKKIRLLMLAMLCAMSGLLCAQNEISFEQMIPVRVLMPKNNEIKGDAITVLYNNVNQAVTLNGLGSTTDESRFIIVTSVTILSKNVTTSIPPQYLVEIEVAFYFVDNINKVILSQEIITKKAMDDNDNKAISKAIKSIKARDPKLKKLINIGKNRAVEYYKAIDETESEDNADPDVSWIYE